MTIPARLYSVLQIDADLDNQDQALAFRTLYLSIDDAKAACANVWRIIYEGEELDGACPEIAWSDPGSGGLAQTTEGSVEAPGLISKVYVITPHELPAQLAQLTQMAETMAHMTQDGELLSSQVATNDYGAEWDQEAPNRYRFSMSGDDACSALGCLIDAARAITGHAPANLIKD